MAQAIWSCLPSLFVWLMSGFLPTVLLKFLKWSLLAVFVCGYLSNVDLCERMKAGFSYTTISVMSSLSGRKMR